MDKNQKFFPDFGYDGPIKTKQKCSNPAFLDHNLHRIGVFKNFHSEPGEGFPGWFTVKRCVNCGRVFDDEINYFYPDGKEVNPHV